MKISTYNKSKYSLTQKQLKIIAIIAMVLDHVAWKFIDPNSISYQIMHFIGRFTMPIMCYFIAEGFFRTKNVYKYFTRLFSFALISHFIFQYYLFGFIPIYRTITKGYHYDLKNVTLYTSVFYTLSLGLLSLIVIYKLKINTIIKALLIILILFISEIGDYGYIGVLWVINFGVFHNELDKMTLGFLLITTNLAYPFLGKSSFLYIYGTYIPILFIYLYNGEKGKGSSLKWFFYIFYPLHLLILGILAYQFKLGL